MCDRVLLSATILAQRRHPVASSEALDLRHQGMRAVLYWPTAMAIKMANKIGAFCHRCFVCSHSGDRRGDTEQVITRWRHPVASDKALDVLQPAMHTVLHPCLHMAIEIAHNGGTFVCHCRLFCMIIHNYKTMS